MIFFLTHDLGPVPSNISAREPEGGSPLPQYCHPAVVRAHAHPGQGKSLRLAALLCLARHGWALRWPPPRWQDALGLHTMK